MGLFVTNPETTVAQSRSVEDKVVTRHPPRKIGASARKRARKVACPKPWRTRRASLLQRNGNQPRLLLVQRLPRYILQKTSRAQACSSNAQGRSARGPNWHAWNKDIEQPSNHASVYSFLSFHFSIFHSGPCVALCLMTHKRETYAWVF